MSAKLLVTNGTVVTLGETNRVLPDHAVLCEGDRIVAIAPSRELTGPAERIIDASGKLVMPGFINVHMHFYSSLVCGLGKAAPSKDFVEVLEHLWWRLDKKLDLEDCHYSALVACLGAIRHGTTTLIDHHASPFAVRGSLDRVADAVAATGLRSCLCYELSDRDGAAIAGEGIEENVAFANRCKAEGNPHLSAMFGMHAAFTLSDATLERAAAAGHEHGLGFHVHTAEAASDQEANLESHGRRVVERWQQFGVLGPSSIAAHCVHVNDREIALLAESGTPVAHNPQSNMNNAVGVADVLKLASAGIVVGLGTDAMTTNMLEELRAAMWVRHLAADNPSVGFMETTAMLVHNNAAIANRHFPVRLGELAVGAAADLVCIDYQPPTPLDETTFLGHLVFGVSQSVVDTTICGGSVLMTGKRLELDLDEAEVAARARERAKALWERF
jgi:putative selenium metabolism protein SsnA